MTMMFFIDTERCDTRIRPWRPGAVSTIEFDVFQQIGLEPLSYGERLREMQDCGNERRHLCAAGAVLDRIGHARQDGGGAQ
jgi:hypothetical protein